MCMSMEPSVMSKTILYAGEALIDNKLVHVLAYQNQVENTSDKPNAMILPFPTSANMDKDNVIDISNNKELLKNYATAIKPRSRGRGRLRGFDADSHAVKVFETGSYTVVLGNDPLKMHDALLQVAEERRPELKLDVLQKIADTYPRCPIALCCFNNKDMKEAEPIAFWYEPKNAHELFAPALDSHDGKAPDLEALVKVDHSVIFGSTFRDGPISFYHLKDWPDNVRQYFGDQGFGVKYQDILLPNGDFIASKKNFRQKYNNNVNIERKTPSL